MSNSRSFISERFSVSVSITKTNNISTTLETLFADLRFTLGKRVFVKPNLCGREPVLPEKCNKMKLKGHK
jgi:hypothetical protein